MRLDHLLSRETAELETAKLKDLRSIDELRKQGVRKRSVKDAKERQSTFENPERKRRMQGKKLFLKRVKLCIVFRGEAQTTVSDSTLNRTLTTAQRRKIQEKASCN